MNNSLLLIGLGAGALLLASGKKKKSTSSKDSSSDSGASTPADLMSECKRRLTALGYSFPNGNEETLKVFKDHYNAFLEWYNYRAPDSKRIKINENIDGSCSQATLDMISMAETIQKAGRYTVKDSRESMDTLYGGWLLVASQAMGWRWLYGSPDYKDPRPDCNTDELLMVNQLYRDTNGTFFYVTPDKTKLLVSADKPLDLGLEYNHVNGEMVLNTAGSWAAFRTIKTLSMAAGMYLGGAFLPGFIAFSAAYFGSMAVIPTKARIEIKYGGVPYLIISPWAGLGADREEKIKYIDCKNKVQGLKA
jgi:hypothetical protein